VKDLSEKVVTLWDYGDGKTYRWTGYDVDLDVPLRRIPPWSETYVALEIGGPPGCSYHLQIKRDDLDFTIRDALEKISLEETGRKELRCRWSHNPGHCCADQSWERISLGETKRRLTKFNHKLAGLWESA